MTDTQRPALPDPTVVVAVAQPDISDPAHETERIMRTGAIWFAALMLVPGLTLGPMLAGGWRPMDLPLLAGIAFWLGAVAAATGVGLLLWAGCPVPAYALEDAHRQKVFSIRVGVVLGASGLALAGLAILLSPVAGV